MLEESFVEGQSLLHTTDPRIKLIVALAFNLLVALTTDFLVVALAGFVALCLAILFRLPFGRLCKSLLAANGFVLFLWLTLPLTYAGEPMFSLGPFDCSREGVVLSLRITMKVNTIVLGIICLLATSNFASLGHALEGLGLPRRLCCLLLFSYRYLFVIYEEYQRLMRAATLRCFKPATTVHTYKTVAYLFAMTLIKSYDRGSRIHQAMLLRGFDGRFRPLSSHTLNRFDIIFFLISLLIIAGLFFLHFT
ncbi:MAG: cobalt ECF transporter T component CbiQ [Deltaproteobacteria bacterium]|nr:MAG: cobalt ECF transporter T component CbiQ [Deltaproteobacteria bacterium]PIE73314.1 MAG: cobalt ECF transporter T component CbiQ [Deltaproteobacteria bacterium]